VSRAFAASLALFALGLACGAWSDRGATPRPALRDGYVVLEADLHAHTRFSDGLLSPFDLVVHARRQRLHALAVTEHNLVFPAQMARWFSRATGGPLVIVGEEITSSLYHVHAFGLTSRVRPTPDLGAVIDAVHAQGGLVVAAHPVRHFWPSLLPVRARLDGAEVMHPIAYRPPRAGWDWSQMIAFYEDSLAEGHRLTAIGASDYHGFSPLGLCRTLIFAREATESSALEALRAGRTVVVDHRGGLWGDPALCASLRATPYRSVARAPGYPLEGPLDAPGRAMGWVGLVGMILARRRGVTLA
jgi:hypothetical protein